LVLECECRRYGGSLITENETDQMQVIIVWVGIARRNRRKSIWNGDAEHVIWTLESLIAVLKGAKGAESQNCVSASFFQSLQSDRADVELFERNREVIRSKEVVIVETREPKFEVRKFTDPRL
jgi:hypothetical protein